MYKWYYQFCNQSFCQETFKTQSVLLNNDSEKLVTFWSVGLGFRLKILKKPKLRFGIGLKIIKTNIELQKIKSNFFTKFSQRRHIFYGHTGTDDFNFSIWTMWDAKTFEKKENILVAPYYLSIVP